MGHGAWAGANLTGFGVDGQYSPPGVLAIDGKRRGKRQLPDAFRIIEQKGAESARGVRRNLSADGADCADEIQEYEMWIVTFDS